VEQGSDEAHERCPAHHVRGVVLLDVFEHLFENGRVSAELIEELRLRVQSMEGRASREPVATHPVLAGLVDLQSGGVYTAALPTLAMLLMAGPSAAGAWSAVVGSPEFGHHAAAELGVDLSRVVTVPRLEPGVDPLAVVAALVDVVDVVVLGPTRISERDAARIAARLRERRCLIVTWGAWPRADAHLDARHVTWHGVGRGHGYLQARHLTVEVSGGGRFKGERCLWLPDSTGQIRIDHGPALRSVS
jgi:hypothetical protein